MAMWRPQMEITDQAAIQLEDKYSDQVSRPSIREAIRKWNAKQQPISVAEQALFQVFREIERKVFP